MEPYYWTGGSPHATCALTFTLGLHTMEGGTQALPRRVRVIKLSHPAWHYMGKGSNMQLFPCLLRIRNLALTQVLLDLEAVYMYTVDLVDIWFVPFLACKASFYHNLSHLCIALGGEPSESSTIIWYSQG